MITEMSQKGLGTEPPYHMYYTEKWVKTVQKRLK